MCPTAYNCIQHKMVALLVVFLVITVAGCNTPTADDPLADHSFLTQQPCASPCWYGLELDKSSADEVYATLKTLPFVDPTTIGEAPTTWLGDVNAKEVGFDCLHPKTRECNGGFIISQGKLKRIALSPPVGLTFQQAVAVLNQPDSIEYRPFHVEAGGCVIYLLWPQKGIIISYIDQTNDGPCQQIRETDQVSPNLTVVDILYITPDVFKTGSNGSFNDRIPWPGFAKQ